MKLRATFSLNVMFVIAAIRMMEARTKEACDVSVLGDASKTEVEGAAQEVMLVIGEIAAQGEDKLMQVNAVS